MKTSKYNKLINYKDTNLMFNSVSCALAEVDNDFLSIINDIESIDPNMLSNEKKELLDNMIDGNYIVSDEIDELNLLKYKNLSSKFSQGICALTIAPTIDCNFACPYCYESPKKGIMSKNVQDSIIETVNNSIKYTNSYEITWYGGEPLVAKDIVLSMSEKILEICETNNIKYSAGMVTNGYLLNEQLIKKLLQLNVTNYQITIDGPPEIHNSRRRLRGSKNDTFYKIIKNVRLLKENGATVSIRINIDNSNIDYIDDLLDIFEENNLKDCTIHFGHIKLFGNVCKSLLNCMNDSEFAKFDLKYNNLLRQRGFNQKSKLYYPQAKSNFCCADSNSSWVIDPDGYMYNCWNEVGNVDKASGNIMSLDDVSEQMMSNNTKYMLWSPFDNKDCKECSLLPICMGGCPDSGLKSNSPQCEKWKYILDECIVDTYISTNMDNIKNV